MTVLNIILRTIFLLTIAVIVVTIFTLTVGQWLPIEFRDNKMQRTFYDFVYTTFPLSILLTLSGTIKKKNKRSRNWTIGSVTVLSTVLCYVILVGVMFSIGFGAWTNETILFVKKDNTNISINQQIFDIGALGTGAERTVQLSPFLTYFQKVKIIDTNKIDKAQWTFVNAEGDIHFP